jgi:hypothetical protein
MIQSNVTRTVALSMCIALVGVAEAASDKPRASRERATEVIRQLTSTGEQLAAQYAAKQKSMQSEIVAALPDISDAQKSALLKSFEAESDTAEALAKQREELRRVQKPLLALERLRAASQHYQYTMQMDQDALKRAMALPDDSPGKAKRVESARKAMEAREKTIAKSLSEMETHENNVNSIQSRVADAAKQVSIASEQHAKAKTKTCHLMDALTLEGVLSGTIDTQLATYMIITEATPRKLAEYAQQGSKQQQIVEELLSKTPLMVEMLVADGATWGKYGQAMELYNAIQQASDKAKDGVLQRLALAIAVHHAVPMRQDTPEAIEDSYIDPIKRYKHYEAAYLNGELDPSFTDQCAWSLRMVVNDVAPDESLAWGREMFRTYRPDLLQATLDEGRYVNLIDQEISYTSKRQKNDKPEHHQSQNILSNGGLCGRRAGLGRFLLRAFGVPTTNRPQKGHAALVHYAPGGWIPQLGAGWGHSNKSVFGYMTDLDFQDSTQARQSKANFLKVKRAQWIAHATGETPITGMSQKSEAGFWNSVALIEQQRLSDDFEATAEPQAADVQVVTLDQVPSASRTVTVDNSGVITIPALAVTYPTQTTKQSKGQKLSEAITFMASRDGGWQLHFSKNAGWGPSYQYQVDVPRAGTYRITARIATPGESYPLRVAVNNGPIVEMPVPDTIGLWETSEPITIALVEGSNTLTISGPYRGSIKEFKLTPAP